MGLLKLVHSEVTNNLEQLKVMGDSRYDDSLKAAALRSEAWVEFLGGRMVDDRWRNEMKKLDRTHLLDRFEITKVSADWAATLQKVFDDKAVPA